MSTSKKEKSKEIEDKSSESGQQSEQAALSQVPQPPQQGQTDKQRRKASIPHRFSVDYYGFPRITEESDESSGSGGDPGGGTATNNNSDSYYYKNIFIERSSYSKMDEVRGNRGLQYMATFAANMGAFACGTALSYPAVALPSLRDDVHFKGLLTEKEESWIGSVFALGAVVSGPAAGFAIEKMGRRMSMMVLSVPFFLSWMLIHVASDVALIIVGRFLTGFFSGVFLVAAPIFTAEISDIAIRGAMGATFDMSSSVGILFIYIVGTYCNWRHQALICALIPILIFILMLFIPESPAYLLKKGRTEEAKEALTKYKGKKNNPDFILAQLDSLQQEVVDSRASESVSFRDLCQRPILIPVFISLMIFVFQVICGLDPILVYTVDIFHSAGGGGIDEYTSTIILGVIELVAGILAAFFVDKTGRRFLLLLSEIAMILSLIALGFAFFITRGVSPPIVPTPPSPPGVSTTTIPTTTIDATSSSILTWLPLTSLSIYIFAYSVGLGPVGYLLMGEILPLRVKGLAGCLLTSLKWLFSFLVTKFFNNIVLSIGEAGCFWLFAGLCGLGLLFIILFVPETNGRSLEDIQRSFRRRYSMENIHAAVNGGDGDGGETQSLLTGGGAVGCEGGCAITGTSQYKAINVNSAVEDHILRTRSSVDETGYLIQTK